MLFFADFLGTPDEGNLNLGCFLVLSLSPLWPEPAAILISTLVNQLSITFWTFTLMMYLQFVQVALFHLYGLFWLLILTLLLTH